MVLPEAQKMWGALERDQHGLEFKVQVSAGCQVSAHAPGGRLPVPVTGSWRTSLGMCHPARSRRVDAGPEGEALEPCVVA